MATKKIRYSCERQQGAPLIPDNQNNLLRERMCMQYEILSMALGGSDVYVLNEEGLYWYEIDDPKDLAFAEKNVLPHLK